jgi:dienelactone hydrolase
MISVLSAYENVRRVYMGEDDRAFAGHVSYYGCSVARVEAPVSTGAPVLMMLAELDKNVSMERTQQIADDLRRGGAPVEVVVFKNIYHQWDGRDETVRFVPFNLSRCRMRLGTDFKIRDERTGIAVRGRISRALIIATSVWSGYEILRDPPTRDRSDEMLLSFLASTEEPLQASGAAMVEGVAAAAAG